MSLRGRQVSISITPICRFLVITVSGVRFAILADYVKGLLTAEEAGPLESLTVQGSTYARSDVATSLHLRKDPWGPDSRIVLISKGEGHVNIRVAEVHGLLEVEASELLPLPPHFLSEERRWYQGMVLFEDSVVLILNPDWLIRGCDIHPVGGDRADPGSQTPSLMGPALVGRQM